MHGPMIVIVPQSKLLASLMSDQHAHHCVSRTYSEFELPRSR